MSYQQKIGDFGTLQEGGIPWTKLKLSLHKTIPNDPCPCGSGKKYKKCHGV